MLIGYGKMGKTIEQIALQRGHQIVAKIDIQNTDDIGKNPCDVAIEFTNPKSAVNNLINCFNHQIKVVCGTTGWLSQLPDVIDFCNSKNGSLLYASNFSIGVNIFFEINKRLASLMYKQATYNVHIEEIHHTAKLDAPSGTAITLAEEIMTYYSTFESWINEVSTNPNELSIISQRVDNVPGTHTIFYDSLVDSIELKHTAHTRVGFALGAVVAAEWLANKQGVFTMQDVLQLNI